MTTTDQYLYHKKWKHERAHGILRTVDAEPVKNHLAMLTGQALSMRAISAEAGVSVHTVSAVIAGQSRVTRKVAQKILSVSPKVPDKASRQTTEPFVPKIGAVRRIQGLLAIGWRYSDMAAAGAPRCQNVIHQQGRWITRTTHNRVAVAYRSLVAQGQGPSQKTRTLAAQRGYQSPAYWDDIDLDVEPEELEEEEVEMDEVAVLRRMGGDKQVKVTRVEQAEVVRRMRDQGMYDSHIEELTGINVQRHRRSHD